MSNLVKVGRMDWWNDGMMDVWLNWWNDGMMDVWMNFKVIGICLNNKKN